MGEATDVADVPTGCVEHLLSDTVVDAARWTSMHRAQSRATLRDEIERELLALVPFHSVAILLLEDDSDNERVECTVGLDCPLEGGSVVEPDAWNPAAGESIPIFHDDVVFGRVVIAGDATGGDLSAKTRKQLESLFRHYSTALTSLMAREEMSRSNESLHSSLQAYQDGVILFQLQDAEMAGARFLQLCMNVLGGQAGALFLLEQINDLDSELVLDQTLGLPEDMLGDLQVQDTQQEGQTCSVWWPQSLLSSDTTVLRRDARTGDFDHLDNKLLPPVMNNIIGMPLRYQGVTVGVCVLLNFEDGDYFDDKLSSMRHLFELGAAVFHRLYLERQALRTKYLDTQVEIASVIQSRLLPQQPPESDYLDVAWKAVMSAGVGGDYLDFIEGEIGGFYATMCDVSGHGIDSALLMSSFRSTYRARVSWFESGGLLEDLNTIVAQEVGDTGMFLTSVTCEINRERREMCISSAGHNPVYLYRAATGTVDSIEASGPPLGLFPAASYQSQILSTDPGDILLLYTDGVVEATAPGSEEEMFGEDRLQQLLIDSADKPAREILDRVFRAVADFSQQIKQGDDVSVLVIKFR